MKRITKNLATVGLVGGILFSSLGTGNAAAQVHYKDVNKSDNFYNSVEYLLEDGAISQTLPKFRPYENITRGQFASIYTKLYHHTFQLKGLGETKFNDVPKTNQYYEFIDTLVRNRIMSGYGYWAETFGVNDSLTRGQVAGILVSNHLPAISKELYKERGGEVSDIFDGKNFKGQWGEALATLDYLGIMSGYNDDTFRPNEPIKRSQFGNIMYNLKKFKESGIVFVSHDSLNWKFEKVSLTEEEAIQLIKSFDNDVISFIDDYEVYNNYPLGRNVPVYVFKLKEGTFTVGHLKIIVEFVEDQIIPQLIGRWEFTVENIEEDELSTVPEKSKTETPSEPIEGGYGGATESPEVTTLTHK
ncbi:hypothetical protein JOD29_002499 [Lysinibacillus composti]|uniref:S-layer homology domain-containing protein n=1 Tax=Lysinibacillus composti TaxID=720633 RepID=A0A3N9UCS4_9BACI|nr:S-layer homology domain-containing protein [Lysinibacillus composti]MBM7609231.1 hypothetical protein [Lysinibacillus composti]RQW74117.1 S-layer homology domain-containing protein [Lysinibacillus composti]